MSNSSTSNFDVWDMLNSGDEDFRFLLVKDRSYELWDFQSASRLILRPDIGEGEIQMLYEASRHGTARELGELCGRTRLLKSSDESWRRRLAGWGTDALAEHHHKIRDKMIQSVIMPEISPHAMRKHFYHCVQQADFGGLRRFYWTGGVIPYSTPHGYDSHDRAPKRFHIWKESFVVQGPLGWSWLSQCVEEARDFTKTPLPWKGKVFPKMNGECLIYLDLIISLPSPAYPDQEPFFYEAPRAKS